MIEGKRVLITGITGFIGAELAKKLVEIGKIVTSECIENFDGNRKIS